MNKFIYLLLVTIASGFVACDPMEDAYEQLDSLPRLESELRSVNVTLTEANYKSLSGKPGVPGYVSSSYYFLDETEAANLIPLYLNTAYLHLEERDAVNVTYNQLVFPFTNNTVSERVSYTLVDADYALGGTTFRNFDRWLQLETFLKAKYPDNKEGRLATLTFAWFNSNVSSTAQTRTDAYYYKNGKWWDAYLVSTEDYVSVDRGRFGNFIAADQTILPDYFNKFLKAKTLSPKVNDVQYVSFANRPASTTTQDVMAMIFDGSNWVAFTKNITIPAVLKFVKKGNTFVPDRTIAYTFVAADYQWVGDDANNIGTTANRANLRQFGNFYQVGNGTDTRYWTDAQVQAGIAARLKSLFPNADTGQKYRVSFVKYTGSNTTFNWTFEKKDSGNYEYLPD
ncbi:hypothetical protein [Desertivirga brevis]|uniref:hypothetical protein n=1 Tax=Desertivirga brevis TaxID=2810310 RepID=UPI001A975946|nr:hypothetical protein [Pedobacter sp. SYSU D00873]